MKVIQNLTFLLNIYNIIYKDEKLAESATLMDLIFFKYGSRCGAGSTVGYFSLSSLRNQETQPK